MKRFRDGVFGAVGGWLIAAVTAPLAVVGVWMLAGTPVLWSSSDLPVWLQGALIFAGGMVGAGLFRLIDRHGSKTETVRYVRVVVDENGDELGRWSDTEKCAHGGADEWIARLDGLPNLARAAAGNERRRREREAREQP